MGGGGGEGVKVFNLGFGYIWGNLSNSEFRSNRAVIENNFYRECDPLNIKPATPHAADLQVRLKFRDFSGLLLRNLN